MTATYEEVPFSELLHRPAATADRLKTVRALRLRRRDADDLALISVDELESETSVVTFASGVLTALLRSADRELLRRVLPEALPWVSFLPVGDVETMLDELVKVTRAASALDNLSPIATLLVQWRHTAEVYADPTLLAILTRDHDDLGPVPRPEA